MTVTDINDNPAQFNATMFRFTVFENIPPLSQVGAFQVTDSDSGSGAENIFSLAGQGSERFSIEILSVTRMSSANSQPPVVTIARIVTSQSLDREDVVGYEMFLTAQDRTSVPLAAVVPVNVTILDANDNNPIFSSPSFAFSISEGTVNTLIIEFTVSKLMKLTVKLISRYLDICVGVWHLVAYYIVYLVHIFLQVTDADIGINSQVDFSLDPSASNLFIVQSTQPRSANLSFSHPLDRETVDAYSFTVFATDRGSPTRTGSTAISITITVRIGRR